MAIPDCPSKTWRVRMIWDTGSQNSFSARDQSTATGEQRIWLLKLPTKETVFVVCESWYQARKRDAFLCSKNVGAVDISSACWLQDNYSHLNRLEFADERTSAATYGHSSQIWSLMWPYHWEASVRSQCTLKYKVGISPKMLCEFVVLVHHIRWEFHTQNLVGSYTCSKFYVHFFQSGNYFELSKSGGLHPQKIGIKVFIAV